MSHPSTGQSSKSKAGSSQPYETTSFKRKRGVFQKDLQHMMYGFGDDPNPLPETVALVEDIVVDYVTDLAHKAQDIGSKGGKLSVEDFLYLIPLPFVGGFIQFTCLFMWWSFSLFGIPFHVLLVFNAIHLFNT